MSVAEIPSDAPARPDDGRRGRPFTLRLEPPEEDRLRQLLATHGADMPWTGTRQRSLGAFIVWAALQHYAEPASRPGHTRSSSRGHTRSSAVRPRRRRRGKTGAAAGAKRGKTRPRSKKSTTSTRSTRRKGKTRRPGRR